LFRWNPDAESSLQPVILGIGEVLVLRQDRDVLWIGTGNGLFRLDGLETEWKPHINISRENILAEMYPQLTLNVSWTVDGWGRRAVPGRAPSQLILTRDGIPESVPGVWSPERGRYEATVDATTPGDYRLAAEVTDLHGKVGRDPRSGLTFHVNADPVEKFLRWLVWWLKVAALAYLVSIAVVFLALATAAHWARRALAILTNPWVRRFGLFYGPALLYLPPLQRWVLGPYFRALRGAFASDHPYLPRPVQERGGQLVELSECLDRIRRLDPHVWVLGRPGSGKTELAREVMRRYAAADGLRQAWRQFGFVPIFVPFRDSNQRDVEGMVIEALARAGIPARDDGFFRGMLRTGDFLVILDGVNETRMDDQTRDTMITGFVRQGRRSRLLATSQTKAPAADIMTYTLPELTPDFARQLFSAFVGRGLVSVVPDTLWPVLESGYDVGLVARLARSWKALPAERLEVYQAILDLAGAIPDDDLCLWGWKTWLAAEDRFPADERIAPEVVANFLETHIIVQRGTAGGIPRYGFAHELMQGYLAARWVAVHSTHPVLRLDDTAVWDLSANRQDRVFPFLCELVADRTGPDGLQDLVEFALGSGARARLQDVALAEAKRRGWRLTLDTDAERVIGALCDLTPGQLGTVVVALGIHPADVPGPDQRSGANFVYRRARATARLDRLRGLILGMLPTPLD